GGDPVPARARAEGVPAHLGVHVSVAVDEPGRDDVALGVHFGSAFAVDLADGDDAVAANGDVGPECGRTRAVDDRSPAYHHVVGHCSPSVDPVRPSLRLGSAGESQSTYWAASRGLPGVADRTFMFPSNSTVNGRSPDTP